jgi:2-desacetyl-2-hydroxyethyl bacteriochlorophyllide A dehydrogenase
MSAAPARAFWIAAPGEGTIRDARLPPVSATDVLVRAEFSGISRGTEALVFRGSVPPGEFRRMRAPFQEGDFPAPVKYGYSSVGIVEDGAADLVGRRVFVLYPHQTRYVVPAAAAHLVGEDVPASRAVLAANMETAVNGLWDAGPGEGQRVVVIGAGTVGCLVAWLARTIAGCRVTLIDVNPARAAVAAALGVGFSVPTETERDADIVVHASGSAAALQLALRLARFEGTIVEMSWFGDAVVPLRLGEDFHSRRLTIKASQVGHVAPSHRGEWDTARRLRYAISLLADPALDVLMTGESPFDDLPATLARLSSAPGDTLCHRIRYV